MSAGIHLSSFSMTIIFLAFSDNNPLVKPPGPGPISIIVDHVKFLQDRAILAVKFRSNKKFCPKFFLAFNLCFFITALIGGRLSIAVIVIFHKTLSEVNLYIIKS